MSGARPSPLAVAVLALASVASLAGGAGALTPAPPTATPKGVGDLRLGRTIEALRMDGLIGRVHKHCRLRPERVATLKPPLEGTARFYPERRLSTIEVTGGAVTAKGVGVGTPLAEALRAYPKAIHRTTPPKSRIRFGVVAIGNNPHLKMVLKIDLDTRRVSEIGIPVPRGGGCAAIPLDREHPRAAEVTLSRNAE